MPPSRNYENSSKTPVLLFKIQDFLENIWNMNNSFEKQGNISSFDSSKNIGKLLEDTTTKSGCYKGIERPL